MASFSDVSFKKASYLGFILDEDSRNRLLEACPPEFEKVVCHHITIAMGVTQGKLSKIQRYFPGEIEVTAIVNVVGEGVQAVVCAINSESQRKFHHSAGSYHVTISLADGHKPSESNHVIALPSGTTRTAVPAKDDALGIKLTGSILFVD